MAGYWGGMGDSGSGQPGASASGTLQVQAATEVAAGAINIKHGSHGIMRTV